MSAPRATPEPTPPAIQVHGWCGCAVVAGVIAVAVAVGVLIGLVIP